MTLEFDPQLSGNNLLLDRLWQYQRERFPLFAHGIALAAFTVAALSVSASFDEVRSGPELITFAAAFFSVLGFFLLLRIADEFKDAHDDALYRPTRPVPRGLVSLSELAQVGAGVAVTQFVVALWFFPQLIWALIAVWHYLVLMSVEFFAAARLRRHPIVYLASHMAILPMIALYASAFHWFVKGLEPSAPVLAGFLVFAVGNGLIFEIGRKVRAPADEQYGVETYSSLWGSSCASGAWAGAVFISIAGLFFTSAQIGDLRFVSIVAVFGGILATVLAVINAHQETRRSAKRIKQASELIVLVFLLSLGVPQIVGLS